MKDVSRREEFRRRLSAIVDIGAAEDTLSRVYDMAYTLAILLNLAASIAATFEDAARAYGAWFRGAEAVTVIFFALDFFLRLWTAPVRRPGMPAGRAALSYLLSFSGLIDLFSFLPYYLPVFFPSGAAAFRMFRVVRIFRLFRINAYYDSLNVIAQVLESKRQQLLSSVFIISVLMLSSSLCMYSLEHEAQPEVFVNAFSGIWWSVSTLLTVGYGDIYPITTWGKVFSIFITFLGVGMVAIPTGIISAGFVDQYSRIKRISEYGAETAVHFICIRLAPRDAWSGKALKDLGLPEGVIVAAIQRRREVLVPRGDVVLAAGDRLVLGAESYAEDARIELKELLLQDHHPWNGNAIRDLDISRKTVIVMVQRRRRTLIPKGSLVLRAGDRVILYTQSQLPQ